MSPFAYVYLALSKANKIIECNVYIYIMIEILKLIFGYIVETKYLTTIYGLSIYIPIVYEKMEL